MDWGAFASSVEGLKSRGADLQKRIRGLRRRLTLLLAVIGPGLITSNVDNDAGGISVYTQAGAQYGYALLWSLIPMTIALYVTEEMCARMGVVTGKGLSDLIREEFGFRPTFFVMITGFFLDSGHSGNVPAGGSHLSFCLRIVFVLCIFRRSGQARLADCRKAHGDSKRALGFGVSGYVDGADRDDDCAVAVFLSSGGFCGEEGWAEAVPAGTRGCHFRQRQLHGDRILHYRLYGGYSVCLRPPQHQRRGDGGSGADSPGGKMGGHAVCVWPVECFVVCGVDSAAFHSSRHL